MRKYRRGLKQRITPEQLAKQRQYAREAARLHRERNQEKIRAGVEQRAAQRKAELERARIAVVREYEAKM